MTYKHRDTMTDEQEIEGYIEESVSWCLSVLSPHTGKMLDAGANYGYAMKLFKERGWEVEGFDINPQQKIEGIRVGLCDMEHLEAYTTNRQFKPNLIFFNHTLEHSRTPWTVMEQAVKVLPRGGVVFIAVPSPNSVEYVTYAHYSLFTLHFLKFMFEELHVRHISSRTVELRSGFEEIQIVGEVL